MYSFHQLINGNGNPLLKWVAVQFTGNTIAKELFICSNYVEALQLKLNHKHRNQITLELCEVDGRGEIVRTFADESNWLDLIDNLKFIN